jgi:predicted PurR-regulated permease PerM
MEPYARFVPLLTGADPLDVASEWGDLAADRLPWGDSVMAVAISSSSRQVGFQGGNVSQEQNPEVQRSQVTLKTVFTICFGVLAVTALVAATLRALVVVVMTLAALLLAVALDHPVSYLQQRRAPRWLAITVVVSVALFLLVILGYLLIPPAVAQAQQLIERIPELIASIKRTRVFTAIGERTGLTQWIGSPEGRLVEVMRGAASPLLWALGSVLTFVGGLVTVVFLTVFMLIFGAPLIQSALDEALPERRATYAALLGKIYSSLGGYLGGMLVICSINATLTTIFLAINGVPFFLPLGIVSGIASLVPYAGPVVAAIMISLLSAIGGFWHGLASAIYFFVYGQIEGNVIGPLVFKQTVHVDPLVVLLSVLFFGDMAGVAGAIAAVPAAATIQIVVRELLRHRRAHLQPQRD